MIENLSAQKLFHRLCGNRENVWQIKSVDECLKTKNIGKNFLNDGRPLWILLKACFKQFR